MRVVRKLQQMSFITALFEQFFGRLSPESPLLPLHSASSSLLSSSETFSYEVDVIQDDEGGSVEEEEDEEEEEDPEAFRSNQEFVQYILDKSDDGNNYFFDMFNTETRRRVTGRVVQIWWMSRLHPYACMLRRSGAEQYQAYDAYREVVAYHDDVIQEAVEATKNIVSDWLMQQQKNSPEIAESSPPPPEEDVVTTQPLEEKENEKPKVDPSSSSSSGSLRHEDVYIKID